MIGVQLGRGSHLSLAKNQTIYPIGFKLDRISVA